MSKKPKIFEVTKQLVYEYLNRKEVEKIIQEETKKLVRQKIKQIVQDILLNREETNTSDEKLSEIIIEILNNW